MKQNKIDDNSSPAAEGAPEPVASRSDAGSPPARHSIESPMGGMHVLEYGNAQYPPLIFLHGMRDLAWSLHPVSQLLAKRFRVLVPDLPGHGLSDHWEQYSMSGMIASLGLLIKRFELQEAILVGHSAGAHIASSYAALFPERCQGLCLIEGLGIPPHPSFPSTGERQRLRRRSLVENLMSGRLSSPRPLRDAAEAQQRLLKNNPRLTPEHAALIAEHGIKPGENGYVWRWDPQAQTLWSTVGEEDFRRSWSWVRCPALVITAGLAADYWRWELGADEPGWGHWRPEDLQEVLSLFHKSSHVHLPEAGHMTHYDQPRRLAELLIQAFARKDDELPVPPEGMQHHG